MNWELYIARSARKQLKAIGRSDRKYILIALKEMRADPFSGDVKWLKNQPHTFRRRVSAWRILYDIDIPHRVILVGDIVRRADNTYS